MRALALVLAIAGLTATAARSPQSHRAVGTIAATGWAYLPGSLIRLSVDGFHGPYGTALLGPGDVAHGVYRIPSDAAPGVLSLAAGNALGLAQTELRIAAPPSAGRALLAVASYEDGVAFHDPHTFEALGLLATGGVPSDVAFGALGRLASTDTQGNALNLTTIAPWNTSRIEGVPLADEVAIDARSGAIFATNRDDAGAGALTRIALDGSVARVVTGQTAEGLAIDVRRGLVYVANVNDGTIAAVDASTMRVRARFAAVARVFSLALSPDGKRLFAVSNQSASSPFAAAGSVVAIALDPKPHVVTRSAALTFPVGIALDPAGTSLFVTDEADDAIDVLDAASLRARRPPIATCRTPWKPFVDAVDRRLYVPCARADQIDVLDLRTLHRIAGAPFATGGYPLAVAVWHPARISNHRSS